jgi:hypothetical protein
MSTAAATARYIISAEDKTKDSVRSILKGFKDMDRDIRGLTKTANELLGIFIGVKLTEGFRKVLDATAKSNGTFATSLREVKDAATDLLSAKSGLPEATRSMQELRDVLKDPVIKAAADSITSSLISGFAKTAKLVAETIAGIKILASEGDLSQAKTRAQVGIALDSQIEDRKKRIGDLYQTQADSFGLGGNAAQQEIDRLQAEIDALTKAQSGALSDSFSRMSSGRAGHQSPAKIDYSTYQSVIGDRIISDEEERHDKFMRNITAEINYLKADSDARQQHVKDILDKSDQFFDRQKAIDALEEFDLNAIEAKKIFSKRIGEMEEYAKEAAKNIQDAFANFFFDPFHNGLKGLLIDFLNVIRRVVAEAAAAKVLGSKSSGGFGLGDFISDLFGVAHKAAGGPVSAGSPYLVGEKGPELFVPRGNGSIIPNGARGGGTVFAPVYNIDARGATQDVITALPAILRQSSAALKSEIFDELDRMNRGLRR